jgi:protein O-GlcNAc transferase
MDPLAYFLAFSRLAPVQCLNWCHPVTSGIPNIDYFLSAQGLEPPGAAEHYSEMLVQLSAPPTYLDPLTCGPSSKSLEDFGLAGTGTLYVCPQSLFKIHPDFDPILDRILRADPAGQVVLPAAKDPAWQQAIVARFQRSIPQTFSRVRFVPRQTPEDLLRLMQLADVILDTTHFSGGLTTIESLHVGQAPITLPGEFMRGRVTNGYYRQMGFSDCIAQDVEDYVRLALRMANDRTWREEMRAAVRDTAHKLYRNRNVVGEIERFFVSALQQAKNITKSTF